MENEFYFTQDFEKTENWDKLLDLTHTVWRVVDLTTDNDFLRTRIKQSSCDILAQYPVAISEYKGAENLIKNINTHIALLSLAQKVSRSKEINFLILKNEYKKIIFSLSQKLLTERQGATVTDIEPAVSAESGESPRSSSAPAPSASRRQADEGRVAPSEALREGRAAPKKEKEDPFSALNDRQAKIVQFFQKKKSDKLKLRDITGIFPGLTDRTIRNDLKDLCSKKIVSRSDGFGQASFYTLVRK